MQEPTSSSAEENIPSPESPPNDNEEMKNNLTNALIYCKSLLEAENLLTNTPPTKISEASIAMGEEIFKEIIFMLQERKIIIDDDLICAEEIDVVNQEEYKEVSLESFLNHFIFFFC